ncbi:retrotransposable element Tf2 [Tanacetum coccineum]
MRKLIKKWVQECDVCQRNKSGISAYLGLLQPLLIPSTIWSSISMDFIEGLPNSSGKTVIFVVVDKLSKYANFMALLHPFIASTVAQVFLDHVYKVHGLPNKVFISHFWQSFFKMRKLSCNYPLLTIHKQMAKQKWTLEAREQAIELLKFHLKRAQDRMKNIAGGHRTYRKFEVGMMVYLKLQSHRHVTIRKAQQNKLSSKYFGPFEVLERIGEVAYKLKLPTGSMIHPVFHVSQLKKCKGTRQAAGTLPQCNNEGVICAYTVE